MPEEDLIDYVYEMKHERMPLSERASIFSPFSALSGFNDMIKEENRFLEEKKELLIDAKEELNYKIDYVKSNMDKEYIFWYFKKDNQKKEGQYLRKKSKVKKIYLLKKTIILSDNSKISFDDLYNIEKE